jgi:hypothetical protein
VSTRATSIRAVTDYLGHSDPGITLRTYTHLLPTTEDRARQAVDAVFGERPEPREHRREAVSDSPAV